MCAEQLLRDRIPGLHPSGPTQPGRPPEAKEASPCTRTRARTISNVVTTQLLSRSDSYGRSRRSASASPLQRAPRSPSCWRRKALHPLGKADLGRPRCIGDGHLLRPGPRNHSSRLANSDQMLVWHAQNYTEELPAADAIAQGGASQRGHLATIPAERSISAACRPGMFSIATTARPTSVSSTNRDSSECETNACSAS